MLRLCNPKISVITIQHPSRLVYNNHDEKTFKKREVIGLTTSQVPYKDIKRNTKWLCKLIQLSPEVKWYRNDTNKENYPLNLYNITKHSHKTIEDAREYFKLLVKLLNKK